MTELIPEPSLLEKCLRYLVLGVIQGITEFLPISSTAHVKVLPVLLGWVDPGVSVTAVIQLGSILAVITYFKQELRDIIKGIERAFRYGQWQEKKARLGIAIFAGTLPIIVTGMVIKLFWKDFEDSFLRSIPSIALISIAMAILLCFAERNGKRLKSINNISVRDGIIIGLGQILALIPGVSRSGITLTSSLLDGWKRQDAARFSFLIGIPAISISGLVELKDALDGELNIELIPLLIGIFSAAIVSWLTIKWLLKYLQSNSTWIFIIYRLLFGSTLMLWWWGTNAK